MAEPVPQMLTVHICLSCYTGRCAECVYISDVGDCFCARMRHSPDLAAACASSRQYDVDGNEVHWPPPGRGR